MAKQLAVGVVLRHPDTGAPVFLPAGSDAPGWASGLLGDHVFAGGPRDAQPGVEVADPPSKAGAGSSRARWADYATAAGVTATEDMSRDDIIDACTAAGVRTE